MKLPVKTITNNVVEKLSKKRAVLLTGGEMVFSGAGIALMYRNSEAIHDAIDEFKGSIGDVKDDPEAKKMLYVRTFKKLVLCAGPILACYAGAVTCSVMSYKDSKKKDEQIATLTAAYGVTTAALNSYKNFKEEAVKELGEEKAKEVENRAVAENAVQINEKMAEKGEIPAGYSEFIDPFTMQIFYCNKKRIEEIEAVIQKELMCDTYIPLTEWYDLIGMIHVPDWVNNAYISKMYSNNFYIGVDSYDYGDRLMYIPRFTIYTLDQDGELEELMC